jgi:hypothetical protein
MTGTMTGLRNNIFYTAIMVILFSCSSKKEMDRESYLNYLNSEESGLLVTKTLNGITYQLKCLLPEQQCLQFNKSTINSQKDFDQMINEYNGKLSFILLIKDENGSGVVKKTVFSQTKYAEVVEYANTDQPKDIILETDQSELQCSMLHLESSNSVQPILRMILSFGKVENPYSGFTIIFNDNVFGNGPVKFNFSKNLLENLPKLKMQSIS